MFKLYQALRNKITGLANFQKNLTIKLKIFKIFFFLTF
jgi:hypothetical protein